MLSKEYTSLFIISQFKNNIFNWSQKKKFFFLFLTMFIFSHDHHQIQRSFSPQNNIFHFLKKMILILFFIFSLWSPKKNPISIHNLLQKSEKKMFFKNQIALGIQKCFKSLRKRLYLKYFTLTQGRGEVITAAAVATTDGISKIIRKFNKVWSENTFFRFKIYYLLN